MTKSLMIAEQLQRKIKTKNSTKVYSKFRQFRVGFGLTKGAVQKTNNSFTTTQFSLLYNYFMGQKLETLQIKSKVTTHEQQGK